MKVNKGYSLSQFVDYLFADDGECKPQIKDSYIGDYNDFLKQPLTKEMFVNECTLPDEPMLCKSVLALDNWREKEKKVIFEGFECYESQAYYSDRITVKWNNAIFPYGDHIGVIIPREEDGKTTLVTHLQIKTLHDLFEATNGELKLKNVTI